MLKGKVVIVTGSTGDIGKATVKKLCTHGAIPVLIGRDREKLRRLSREVEKEGFVSMGMLVDIVNKDEVEIAVKRAYSELGKIDGLVNLAGYPMDYGLWRKDMVECSDEEIENVLQIDLMGTIRFCRSVIKFMVKDKGGVIVNISSTPALTGYDKGFPYTVAKAAIIGVTKHIAYSYGKYGIRAYTIALGSIKTSRTYEPLSYEERNELASETSLKRWGDPGEVADVIAFLLSDLSSYMNGQTIVIDGGSVMI